MRSRESQAAFVEARWAETVRRGTRWLFWMAMISGVLPNLIGFVIPFVGGTRADLKWASVAAPFTGMGILYAVWVSTAYEPYWTSTWADRRVVLRGVAGLYGVVRAAIPFLFGLGAESTASSFVLIGRVADVTLAALFFLYARSLAGRFELKRLGRTAGTLAWLYPLTFLGKYVLVRFLDAGGWSLVVALCDIAWDLSVGIWALVFLWRFGSRICPAVRGRCVGCGYWLAALTENRCPECGMSFSEGWEVEGLEVLQL